MPLVARASTTSDAFNAIAEPQRRRILTLLRHRDYPVNDVALALRITQPRASKHLRVLRQVGLVHVHRAGKERVYSLDARGLRPIHEWAGGFEQFWNESFLKLNAYVQHLVERSSSMAESEGESATDRELVVRHTIDGPRDLVFTAYTAPEHLDRWFGPHGFVATTHAFEFRPGGIWEFTMRGRGIEYPNWIQWLEIERPERIVYVHGAHAEDPRSFVSTITLVEVRNTTEITLHSIFKTKQQRDEVVERFHAEEAGKQTLTNLGTYVAELMSQQKGQTTP
jgi:uncharacterized protein YndB with AHSA1/START domain/DNA-binding transcriptional ArsR family regulator